MTEYKNPGTVVVPMVSVNGGLLLVRRKLKDGYGKLALPGGYQSVGETWREAGVREVREETGINITVNHLYVDFVETVEEGSINLIFCSYLLQAKGDPKPQEDEVLEIVIAKKKPAPEEVAFPTHYKAIDDFFRRFHGSLIRS